MINLTDRYIKSLKAENKAVDVYDSKLRGFGLRARPSGKKTYFLLYTNHLGKQRRITISDATLMTLSDARSEGLRLKALAKSGEDPAEKRSAFRKAETLSELAETFLIHSKEHNRLRTYKEYERQLRKTILPVWGSTKVIAITRADVIAMLDNIRQRGAGVYANRIQALISRIFNYAKNDLEIIERNPAQGISKKYKEKSKSRVLNDEEIKKLNEVLINHSNQIASLCIRLILLTGVRPGEAEKAVWSEIDFDKKIWTIPAERMKGKRTHTIPLTTNILFIFESAKSLAVKLHGEDVRHVFPRLSKDTPYEITKTFKKTIASPSGFTFSPHDLRRTVSTRLQELEISHEVIEMILAHRLPGISEVYQKGIRSQQVKNALVIWHVELSRLIEGKVEQKVINILKEAA